MFFKVIYYLIGIGIVLYNLYRLSDKRFSYDLFEWYQIFQEKKKEGKEKEALKIIENDKDFAIKIIVFSFFMYKVSVKSLKNNRATSYIKEVNFKIGVSIAIILFAIINTFHLHIDLIKLIFGV